LIIVCGRTGTGKTRAIEQLNHCSVDLEGLAHHRGSTFGYLPEDPDQPSQIDFENSVSIAFLKLLNANAANTKSQKTQKQLVLVEDESKRIGNVALPLALSARMKECDGIVVIEEEMESRVDVLVEDYVLDLGRRYVALYGDERGPDLHRTFLLDGLKRIRKRLGGVEYEQISHTVMEAFREQQISADMSLHRVWITALLDLYYDKMYDYQLTSKRDEDQILFRGDREAVIDWVRAKTTSTMEHQ
jgi:tRNA 2-selenouridine synthase